MQIKFDAIYQSASYKTRSIAELFAPAIAAVKKTFTLDLRALALLRICIAAVVITDQCIRMTDLIPFYSDEGVVPLQLLFRHGWNPMNLSIHTISGLWQVQALLFCLTICFSLGLLLGWRSRLFSVLTWFMVMSVQNRNPFILQGGDDLLRMTLFWGMFLPWDKKYSMDSLYKSHPSGNAYLGMAGVAYMIQIACVYYFSALLKDSAEWRTDGTAIYYALSLDQLVFPLGKWIYQYPQLMKALTFTVFYTELIAPFLLFIPVFPLTFRMIGVSLFIMLHLGISLTLFVGLFFLIGIASAMGLLSPGIMDAMEKRFRAQLSRMQYFFVILKEKIENWFVWSYTLKVKAPHPKGKEVFTNLFVLSCLLFALLWNVQNATSHKNLTGKATPIGQLMRLDQNWGMFAPTVFKDDGWYVLRAVTEQNQEIDLNRNGKPLIYDKPESVVSLFKNDRWRKYTENYLFVCNRFLRTYYSNYLFDKWNAEHPENPIKKLEVIYMKEVTQPNYKPVNPTHELLASTVLEEDDDDTNP